MADITFALIAGMAIMPAVFSFGISPSEGPGLVFVTLPRIFAQIPFGSILAIVFFFILFIAALTSSISLLEVVVAYLIEEFRIKRVYAVLTTIIFLMFLGTLCSLSQGPVLENFKIAGLNFFDLFDSLSANILMPLGGVLIAIFVGYKLGKSNFIDELTSGGTIKLPMWFLNFIFFSIRYIAPVVVGVILIDGLL